MNLGNKTINKYAKCFFIPFLIILLFTCSSCKASLFNQDVEIKKLKIKASDYYPPVILNNNELFFPGGATMKYVNKTRVRIPARIYHINENKFTELNAYMNLPRVEYTAVKLHDGRILVVGGNSCFKYGKLEGNNAYTILNANNESCRSTNVSELYNPKDNKYVSIKNNFGYALYPKCVLLDDNRVFVFTSNSAEVFDPKSNSFKVVGERKVYKKTNEESVYQRAYYTSNHYKFPTVIKLNGNKLLIYGEVENGSTFKAEVFDGNSDRFIPINIDGDYILQDNAVRISENKLLSIVGDKDSGSVVIYDQDTNKMTRKKLPYAAWGCTLVPLKNNKILMLSGWMDNPDYFPGTRLVKAIYDITNNTITNIKKSLGAPYVQRVYWGENTIIIMDTKDRSYTLYKY